jgi:para-nitrobenzyl esterase
MKKLFTIDDFMVAFIASLGYCFSDLITGLFGWPKLVSEIASVILGMAIEEKVISRIAYSEAIQRDPRRRYAAYAVFVVLFLIAHLASSAFLGLSMFDYLASQIQDSITLPIIGFVWTLLVRAYRVKKIERAYEDGSRGYVFDVDEDEIEEANEENREVTGDYAREDAVRTRTGTYIGSKSGSTMSYLGIPYAKPPVGPLRWKAPEPLDSTDAVFEAKSFGASAIQVEHTGSIVRLHRQSEDCLTLNIVVGTDEEDAKRPVLVLFHGGDFTCGGSADPLYDGTNFVEDHGDVVFVSINYRLGIFGFIDFAEVDGGQAYPEAPNLGLLDQIAALRWIRENIAAFGGDPDRITVVGFDAGADSICLLATSEQAKGLFQRAFVFDGSPSGANSTPDASRALARDLLHETGTTTMEELARLDTQALKDAAQRLWHDLPTPTCDGTLVPKDVYRAWRHGSAAHVEFIVGIPSREMGAIRATIGDRNYPYVVASIVDDLRDSLGESQAKRMLERVERETGKTSEHEALAGLAQEWLMLTYYHCAAMLSDGGSDVRLLYWDQEPLLAKLGSGTTDAVATLLGNVDALALYGNVMDEDVSEVLRAMLAKFAKGERLELYHNEIANVDELEWKAFPEALIVQDDRLRCDTIEGEIPAIEGLPDDEAD